MGCSGCSSGDCGGELPRGCKNNCSCGNSGCDKLSVFDWLSNIKKPTNEKSFNVVEVRFKGSRKEFPSSNVKIKTKLGACSFVKMDVFQRKMWCSYTNSANKSIVELPLDYVNEVIEQNIKGIFPEKLKQFFNEIDGPKNDYENVVG